MKNLGQMMKQAQKLQERMGELQRQQLGRAAGIFRRRHGAGDAQRQGRVRRLKIDPSLVDPEEVEVLEDLIVAACNDAKTKLEAYVAEKMAEVTGGLKLPPGMSLPLWAAGVSSVPSLHPLRRPPAVFARPCGPCGKPVLTPAADV
ncbi:MAG: YbaB/EbfC family nucleoid-associated protein [Rhodospirillales bacterium]